MNPFKTPEEALEAAIKSGWVEEFEGMNCDDYSDEMGSTCGGWDGESRRCECGNRRVNWEVWGNDKDGYVAHAVAF